MNREEGIYPESSKADGWIFWDGEVQWSDRGRIKVKAIYDDVPGSPSHLFIGDLDKIERLHNALKRIEVIADLFYHSTASIPELKEIRDIAHEALLKETK